MLLNIRTGQTTKAEKKVFRKDHLPVSANIWQPGPLRYDVQLKRIENLHKSLIT
jgi:hypothetical protein